MITHITKGTTMEYRGSQNDVKPLNVANGSVFIEIETGAKYLYDAENSLWVQWNETGISDEKIQDAVDNYLEEHPVSGEDLVARAGVSQLSEEIVEIQNGKLNDESIKVEKLEGVIKTGGYENLISGETLSKTIGTNGEINDSSAYSLYVEKIPTDGSDTFYRKNTNGYAFYCCYDENDLPVPRTGGRIIVGIGVDSFSFDKNCAYVRIAEQNALVSGQIWSKTPIVEGVYNFNDNPMYADLKEKIDAIPTPTETKKYPILKDKKWLFMGDSVTEGYGASDDAHKYVNKCIEYSGAIGTNRGVGGSTISWRGTNIEASNKGIYTLSTEIDFSQYDLVTIFSGTNDWGYPQKIDDLNAAYIDTTPERCVEKALEKSILNILASNPSIKIAVFTPMFRNRKATASDGINSDDYGVAPQAAYDSSGADSGKLYYLYTMADMIEEICKKYHIPCKNMYRTFQCSKQNASVMLNDGVHPTNIGHDMIANVICSFVSANCGL